MDTFRNKNIEIGKGKYHEDMIYAAACAYTLIEKRLNAVLKPHKSTVAKFNILLIIKHVGGEEGITQEALGSRLVVSASNMSRQVDVLEKEGLLSRKPNPKNRREKLVYITRKGTDLLEKIWPEYEARLKEIGDLVSKENQKTLSSLLAQWVKNLG